MNLPTDARFFMRRSAPFGIASLLCALSIANAPVRANADARADFIHDARNFVRLQSFKVNIEYHTGTGVLHSRMVYVAPDRLRIEATSNGIAATRVVIGKMNWVKFGDGKWQKLDMPAGPDPFAAVHDMSKLTQSINGYVVKSLGTQSLDGAPMHVYQYTPPAKAGYSGKVSRIWIGAADGFPHKIEQSNGPLSATLTYSGFNLPLSVSGPE